MTFPLTSSIIIPIGNTAQEGGVLMKKYHLADALTALEVLMAFTLIGMTVFQIPADIAIWPFIIGELADAFDGPCARHWPYPDDNKHRWWRQPKTVKHIEHFSDIFIAVSCMAYLISQPVTTTFQIFGFTLAISRCAFHLGVFIIVICTIFQLAIYAFQHEDPTTSHTPIKHLILVRRWIYAFVGIGGGVFLLIVATSWSFKTKLTLIFAGIIAAMLLLYYKYDRATDPS